MEPVKQHIEPVGQFRAIDWLELLNGLSRDINLASGNIEATLKTLIDKLLADIGVDAVAVWTIEEGTDFMKVHSSAGLSERYVRFFNKTDRIRVGRGIVGNVMSKRQSVSIANLQEYREIGVERWSTMLEEEGVISILAAPMFVGQRVIGTFNLYYKREHGYSDYERLFTEVLANQIAVAFENMRNNRLLREDTKRYQKQIGELIGIQRVTQTLNLYLYSSVDKAAEYLGHYLEKTFNAAGLAIFRATEEGGGLELMTSYNLTEEERAYLSEDPRKTAEETLAGAAFTAQEARLSQRIFTDKHIEKGWATILAKEHITAAGAFPLVVQNRVIGALSVYYDHLHNFSEEEISALNTFSQFLGISLENISIFQTLAAEKRKSESIVYSLSDGLVVYNLERRIEDVNPRAEELLGIKKEDVLGHFPREFRGDANTLQDIAHISLLSLDDFASKEVQIKDPAVFLEVTHVPLYDKENTRIGFLRILHDITEEKEVERLKSGFVSTASHQLRTPLTGINWALNNLSKSELSPDQSELLEHARNASAHTIDLINNLLDVSKIEEQQFKYKFTEGSVVPLIEKIANDLSATAEDKGVEIHIEQTAERLPTVRLDPEKLRIAFRNLMENAVQYARPDTGIVTVRIRVLSDYLSVAVEDNGIGIPPKDQKNLFNKFFRAKNAILFKPDGSGLGLYIAKSIVDKHNGKITVQSAADDGSVFTVRLPLEESMKPRAPQENGTATEREKE